MSVGYNPKIVTNGLVLALDAANPKSYPGSGTAWTDMSGLGNNGTLTNGTTYNANNKGTIVFDGVNDYVSVPSNAAFTFGTGNFTIEAWIYLSGNAALNGSGTRFAQILSSLTGSSSTGLEFNISGTASTTGTGILFINTISGTQYIITATSTISQNAWHHVAVVRNSTTTTIYLDRVSIGSGTLANQTITNSNPIWIGALNVTNYNHYFPGNISNVKLYNVALSAAEVSQNFNALRGRYGI